MWTGNKIGNFFDAITLDGNTGQSWTNYFNVDLIFPTNTGYRNFVQVNEITQNAIIADAGNTRILYGEKPSDVEDEYLYKIELEFENQLYNSATQTNDISSGNLTIVEFTNQDTWSYMLTYPEGSTTYNIFLIDKAINKTLINTFTIKDDIIPPIPLTFNSEQLTTIEKITSQNAYFISGEKEIDSAIFYEGYNTLTNEYESAQIVGYTPITEFSFYIYPDKPSGNLVVKDRAGNRQSIEPRVDISFFITPPIITLSELEQTKFNSQENRTALTNFGLSTQEATKLTSFDFDFSVNRKIIEYTLRVGDTILSSGDSVINQDTTSNIMITISDAIFDQGENIISLEVTDEALNIVTQNMSIIVKSESPSMEIFLTGSEMSVLAGGSSTSRTLKLFGKNNEFTNILINNLPVVDLGTNWMYFENEFNPQTTDIEITIIDDMYNVYKQKIWDKSYYSLYSADTDIRLPLVQLESNFANNSLDVSYASLPQDIKELLLIKSGLNAYSLSNYWDEYTLNLDNLGLEVPSELNSYIVALVAKDKSNEIITDVDLKSHDVLISIKYPNLDYIDPEDFRMIYYNSEYNQWETLSKKSKIDESNNRLFARIQHTGLYRLATLKQFSNSLSNLKVYPNPWVPTDGNQDTGDINGISFDELTINTEISIYTVTGERVLNISPQTQSWKWDGLNEEGQSVFSGVYLYVVDDGQSKKTGKITIIR